MEKQNKKTELKEKVVVEEQIEECCPYCSKKLNVAYCPDLPNLGEAICCKNCNEVF